MKQVEVVIFMGLQDQFREVLDEEKVEEYFMIPKVTGRLSGTDPKLDTHIWPGYFVQYKFCLDEKKYENFRRNIEKKKDAWTREGFLLIVNEIQERCGGCL